MYDVLYHGFVTVFQASVNIVHNGAYAKVVVSTYHMYRHTIIIAIGSRMYLHLVP